MTLNVAILLDSEIEQLFDIKLLWQSHLTALYLISRLYPSITNRLNLERCVSPQSMWVYDLWINNNLFTWKEKLDAYNNSKYLTSHFLPEIKPILERNAIIYKNIRFNKSIISKSQLNEIVTEFADFNFIRYRNYRYKIILEKI